MANEKNNFIVASNVELQVESEMFKFTLNNIEPKTMRSLESIVKVFYLQLNKDSKIDEDDTEILKVGFDTILQLKQCFTTSLWTLAKYRVALLNTKIGVQIDKSEYYRYSYH